MKLNYLQNPLNDAILRSDLAILETVYERVTRVEKKITALSVDDRRVHLLMTMGLDS